MTIPNDPMTLFVTGVTSGLGRAIAQNGLKGGRTIVGTVRRPEDADAFNALEGWPVAMRVDGTDDDVLVTVERTEHEIGPIDVLVANAGYGQEGTTEGSSMATRSPADCTAHGHLSTESPMSSTPIGTSSSGIAPGIANAVCRETGRRTRSLPIPIGRMP
jgi:NAD(P)-dependent dehydrogenase (short-subunit alcohol dehydrogenase family)